MIAGDPGKPGEDAVTAASLNRDVAIEEFTRPELRGGAVLIRMELAPGTRLGWVASVGDKSLAYQQEVLLHPSMAQRIVGVDRSGPIPVVAVEVSAR